MSKRKITADRLTGRYLTMDSDEKKTELATLAEVSFIHESNRQLYLENNSIRLYFKSYPQFRDWYFASAADPNDD